MKIRFLLLNAYAVGGTVRTVVNQANALGAAGHEVELVSVWRERETPAFALHGGVTLRSLVDVTSTASGWRRRWDERRLRRASSLVPSAEVRYHRFNKLTDRRIMKYLRSLDGGVLVTTRPALNLLAAQHAPASVVTVGQEHLHYAKHEPALAREIDRWYRGLDAVTVLTRADEVAYRAVLSGSGTRVVQISNPLADTEPLRSALDRPLIVAAGRLVKAKGFDVLIKAFSQVAAEHPEWQLRIFGSGAEHDALRDLIHAKDLYNHVYLMGRTDRLHEELPKASVFALASRHEGFGMVLAEAMSHGVPPVSFDCPVGPREIITDGEDGLLVTPRNAAALAAALTRLVENADERRRLGERAVVSARRYSMERIRPQWEALFADLTQPRKIGRQPDSPEGSPTACKVDGHDGEQAPGQR